MSPQPQQPKKHRVTNATAVLMFSVALLYDGTQIATDYLHVIPLIGTITQTAVDTLVSIWAWLTFFVWFKLRGINFTNPKRALYLNGAGLLELIPVLNSLTAWMLAVFLMIATTRAEEVLEKAPGGAKIAGVMRAAEGKPGAATIQP